VDPWHVHDGEKSTMCWSVALASNVYR
jgi:hypothetical protein